jgi:hypothetical protein
VDSKQEKRFDLARRALSCSSKDSGVLVEILNTPRVPKAIKEQARWCLRHYPSAWDMKQAAENCPSVFQERMEPLYRMVKQYDQDKENTDD